MIQNQHNRLPAATAPAPQQWQVSTTAIHNRASPIPISFAIPEAYSATATGGPVLLDPYTVSYQLNPPLVIPGNSLCELVQASFAYSQPNLANPGVLQSVPNGNNRLSIKVGAGPWQDIVIPQGLYDYTDVQEQLNIYVRTWAPDGTQNPPFIVPSGTPTDLFQLIGISSTQKLIITLNPAALAGGVFPAIGGFQVSFANPSPTGSPSHTDDSIGPVLGWPVSGGGEAFTAPAGSNVIFSEYAPNVADFGFTTAYSLYMSIVADSYLNGITGQLLYVFPLGAAAPNSIVAFQPSRRFPVQINAGNYSTINIWTADQSGNRLPWSLYQAPFQFSALISRAHADGSL